MRARDRWMRAAWSSRNDEPRCHARHTARALPVALDRRANEADKERMAAPRIRRELGVELAAEKPRMLRQLDHFSQIAGRLAFRPRAHRKTGRLDARQVMIVHLVPMPVALGHRRR